MLLGEGRGRARRGGGGGGGGRGCEAGEQGEGDSGVGTIGVHMAAGLLVDGSFHLRASVFPERQEARHGIYPFSRSGALMVIAGLFPALGCELQEAGSCPTC